jgi:hypothetical protein
LKIGLHINVYFVNLTLVGDPDFKTCPAAPIKPYLWVMSVVRTRPTNRRGLLESVDCSEVTKWTLSVLVKYIHVSEAVGITDFMAGWRLTSTTRL